MKYNVPANQFKYTEICMEHDHFHLKNLRQRKLSVLIYPRKLQNQLADRPTLFKLKLQHCSSHRRATFEPSSQEITAANVSMVIEVSKETVTRGDY